MEEHATNEYRIYNSWLDVSVFVCALGDKFKTASYHTKNPLQNEEVFILKRIYYLHEDLLQVNHLITLAGRLHQFVQELLRISGTVKRSGIACFGTYQLAVLYPFHYPVVIAHDKELA